MYCQGDIIKIEKVNNPVVVVSKEFFNKSDMVWVCPVLDKCNVAPLTVSFDLLGEEKYVSCDQITNFDLSVRGSKKIGELSLIDKMTVSDIIIGIVEM